MTDVAAWLADFGPPAEPDGLSCQAASALIKFVEQHAGHVAQAVATYSAEGRELVVLDFQTGRPQRSAYPIKCTERLGVLFTPSNSMPLVCMLRDDFPDTAHQQLAIEGAPRAICIDDRSWAEARLTWTPAELVYRVSSWFERAARGELHDPRQPLDPVLFGSPLTFLISRHVLRSSDGTDLVAKHYPDHRTMLRVTPFEDARGPVDDLERLCVVTYSIPPEQMRRLQFAPMSLGSLADMLSDRGVDLLADLQDRFSRYLDRGAAWQLNARFVVILEMPIVAPDGSAQQGTDLRAFITAKSVGEVAVALGIAMDQQHRDEGSGIGFVRALGHRDIDQDAVRKIATPSAEVHLEFDRELATRIARRDVQDDRSAVIVGAGAIGSHVADTLVREGRFRWTVIDHDRLLPHNLARHIGRGASVTHSKAKIVAEALSALVDAPEPIAHAIDSNVADDGEHRTEIDDALERADVIIDATASLLAERYLSDHQAQARRASVFFNPSGDAAVLLSEPARRSLTLRDLEAQYLGHVARMQHLARHLADETQQVAYTGACRAITGMIPQSSVMALSGLVSAGLGAALDDDAGIIRVLVDQVPTARSAATASLPSRLHGSPQTNGPLLSMMG